MVHRPERSPFQLTTTRCLVLPPSPLSRLKSPDAFPYLSFFFAPKRMSSTMTTTCPHAQVPLICPRCYPLLSASCHHNTATMCFSFCFLDSKQTTPEHTLHCHHAVLPMSHHHYAAGKPQANTRADKCYSTGCLPTHADKPP